MGTGGDRFAPLLAGLVGNSLATGPNRLPTGPCDYATSEAAELNSSIVSRAHLGPRGTRSCDLLTRNRLRAVRATKTHRNCREFHAGCRCVPGCCRHESAAVHGQNTDSRWLSGAPNATGFGGRDAPDEQAEVDAHGRFPGGVRGPFSGRMRTERAAPAHNETLRGQ